MLVQKRMQKRRNTVVMAVMFALAVMLGGLGTVYADSASSANYQVNETQFGIGSGTDICSDQYCSTQSAGDTTVGSASSDSYRAQLGFNTTADPYIEVWTEGGTSDLGTLDVNRTATATNLIKIRNYLSGGYVLQITGDTPSQGTHKLDGMATPSTSHQGAEQFGINLVDNDAPDVGADPVQVPDNTTSFGYVADDYITRNLFKYVDGDIVAQSDSSSGETDYTLSMIVNISNVTPGGRYTGALSAVAVPVY
jgi:hypothetical protein